MKKLFSIFFALAMLLPVSIQAQTDDLHIPQAAKSPEAIQVETVEVQILYTYVNDARSTNSLYQLQIFSSDNLFAVAVPVSSSSQWIVNSFSRTANSAIYTTAASKLSDAAECTGTVINAWGNYYNFNVYIRGKGSYDKYYHLKGYFNSSSLDGTAKLTNDETGGGTFWTNFPTVSSTKSGTTTILTASYSGSENKGTRTNTLKLYFNQTNTSYAPSGLYNISNAGTLGTVKNASGNDNSTNFTSRWTRTGYGTTYNYWYLSAGQVVVFNPNCKSTPIFFQVAAINTANKVVGLMYGTPPAGKYELTVSTYGTGASGSATISCAEGHGYANSTLVDFTYPGSYYYDGTTVTLEAPDAQEGYRFTKWTKNGTQQSTSASYSLGNVSSTNSGAYVANFEGNTYKVVFNGNDNTDGSMSYQTGFKYGTGKALTTNAFSRVYIVTYNYHDATSGNGTESSDATYTFNGWNTAANGSGTSYTNGYSLSTPSPIPSHNGTVNLYAQWNSASVTLPSPEKTGHNFLGWYTEETGGTLVGGAGDSYTPTADIILHARWTPTYTVTLDKNNNGYGTLTEESDNVRVINNVPYGATIVVNGDTITIKDGDEVIGSVVTATPTTNTAQYAYEFTAWKNGTTTLTGSSNTVTDDITITANFTQTKKQYTLAWDVNGGNALTGTYTSGTIDWGTAITKPTDPTKAGYTFGGWDADNDGTADDVAATMPTSDVTYKALWNAISTDLVLKDGVTDGQTDIDFDEFKATYNGQTMSSVTLNRTFTAGNWATICLPFDVDESQLSSTGLLRKVYEFRYATGSADAGKQVTFHFRVATSMEAGRGYLVKGESGMNTSFTFTGVTINTSADTEADVNDLKGVNAYYDESVGSDIVIVGVLRSGTLRADGKKVMGLANNMIWYPHTNGNPMPAYRAYFYNPSASNAIMPRVRIVVEGEGTTELEVVDGELYDASNGFDADGDRQAYRAPSKYIRNGVLIIERNGVRYDAQGKRL